MKIEFNPRIKPLGEITPVVDNDTISLEPLLYSASFAFAASYGGPLTRGALAQMHAFTSTMTPPEGYQWVIDTRSQMLMPGQYPAIPGWHCDGVIRDDYHDQPDMTKMRDDVWHVAVHVSTHESGISNTSFINILLKLQVDPDAVWKSVHTAVNDPAVIRLGETKPGDGNIWAFTQPTLHKANPAWYRGWRWWMRASMYHRKPANRIRNHVQVYSTTDGGW